MKSSSRHPVVAAVLIVTLVLPIGCRTTGADPNFDLLTQPASYKVPAPKPEPEGFGGMVKQAAVTTASFIGAGVLWLGIAALKSWADDDDDDDHDFSSR